MLKFFVTRKWHTPKLMMVLFIIEFAFTIAALALYGIADPDLYRTKLWQNGSDLGFNSNPNELLYAYANYKPISVPPVWSSFITSWNVVMSVLSMFILLVKSTMFVMHVFIPLLSLFVHALLVALYAVSVHTQSQPDLSDRTVPNLQTKGPWYLTVGCGPATQANMGYCKQAQAAFGVACCMLALFATYLILAICSSIPTKTEKAARETDVEMSKIAQYSPESNISNEERWEKQRQVFLQLPKTPNKVGFPNPMTPRTVAFTQLNGGDAERAGSSKGLPFRQQYGASSVPDAR